MRVAFIKPTDPNLTGNNIILDWFAERELVQRLSKSAAG